MNLCAHGGSATVLEESKKEAAPTPLPASGPELAAMMKIGTRVMRGVDWKWGDQVHGSIKAFVMASLLTVPCQFGNCC